MQYWQKFGENKWTLDIWRKQTAKMVFSTVMLIWLYTLLCSLKLFWILVGDYLAEGSSLPTHQSGHQIVSLRLMPDFRYQPQLEWQATLFRWYFATTNKQPRTRRTLRHRAVD